MPPERNIVYKTVAAFRRATGYEGGVRIRISKRIPMGAGLGGGSSDAAAALMALDELAGTGCGRERLSGIAAELGSDVPFFLEKGTAIVGGRGERILPVEARLDYAVVLVHPGFPSDTAAAYRRLDEYRAAGYAGIAPALNESEILRALAGLPAAWPFANDFLPALDANPSFASDLATDGPYRSLFRTLRRSGADFVGLSGSGSVCFGVFSDSAAARRMVSDSPFPRDRVHFTLPLARSGFRVLE